MIIINQRHLWASILALLTVAKIRGSETGSIDNR
jgi:hypothetical protein